MSGATALVLLAILYYFLKRRRNTAPPQMITPYQGQESTRGREPRPGKLHENAAFGAVGNRVQRSPAGEFVEAGRMPGGR